jgi:hypothetical protein
VIARWLLGTLAGGVILYALLTVLAVILARRLALESLERE